MSWCLINNELEVFLIYEFVVFKRGGKKDIFIDDKVVSWVFMFRKIIMKLVDEDAVVGVWSDNYSVDVKGEIC